LAQGITHKYLTRLNWLSRDKHPSLFVRSISAEEIKFYDFFQLEVEFWQEVQLEREMTIIQRLMDEGNCPQRHNTQHIDIPNNDIQHNDI